MLRKYWIELRSSLWFVPGLLVLLAIGLALGLVELDVRYYEALRAKEWNPLLGSGEHGARGMLGAIAASMITVAGVAFSITIVTLSLASTQYTPRILRNFMRDRANQFVLGIFVAIFTYSLIVLRTIRSSDDEAGGGFVPLLAVTFGMLLALLSIGCLIYFIHHIAASIQASTILQAITRETVAAVEVLFPEDLGDEGEDGAAAAEERHVDWHPISAHANGYLQNIASAALMQWADEHETLLRLARGPGEFVHEGAPLVFAERPLDEAARAALRAYFVVGDFRTVEQDALFGIRQIVDIAMKALSPGVNDTSTAVSCLDYLGAILCRLARRRIGSPYRAKDGKLRVIAPTPSFGEFVAKSFDEIRLSAEGNATILLHSLRVLARIAEETPSAGRRAALLLHARLAAELAGRSIVAPYDRERINAALQAARDALHVTALDLPALPAEPHGQS